METDTNWITLPFGSAFKPEDPNLASSYGVNDDFMGLSLPNMDLDDYDLPVLPLDWESTYWKNELPEFFDWETALSDEVQPDELSGDNALAAEHPQSEVAATTSNSHTQIECPPARADVDKSTSFLQLKEWAEAHPGDFYPSTTTKRHLSTLSGLTLKQVSAWFSNYRQRVLRASKTCITSQEQESQVTDAHSTSSFIESLSDRPRSSQVADNKASDKVNASSTIQGSVSTSGSVHDDYRPPTKDVQPFDDPKIGDLFVGEESDLLAVWIRLQKTIESYEPLEYESLPDTELSSPGTSLRVPSGCAWKMGPDATSAGMMALHQSKLLTSEIKRAELLKGKRSSALNNGGKPGRWRVRKRAYSKSARFPGYAGSDTGRTSASGASVGRISSVNSCSTVGSRRGRRIQPFASKPPSESSSASSKPIVWPSPIKPTASPNPPKPSNGRKLHCTICWRSFSRVSALKRHENAVHIGSRRWICGPRQHPPGKSDGQDEQVPDSIQCLCKSSYPLMCGHRMPNCWQQDVEQRTFFRLDGFKRHLNETHRLGSAIKTLNLEEFEIRMENDGVDAG